MPLHYEAGALVEVRGERWLLTRADAFESCCVLTLEGRDRHNTRERLCVIDPFDRPRRISRGRLTRRSRWRVLQSALASIADHRPVAGLWTAAAAAIDLWPYQLEPALAAIGGATRLLLADAVGLGKTIQAGLVLAELRERGWIERALIVCPAGLRHTWARELHDRFELDAVILDQQAIAERIASLPPGVNPWSGHALAIVSIDFLKRPEVLAAIDSQPIDLLVADEAHHLAPGTDRGAAVARLAARVPWCVFLAATPHSGDEDAFNYLTGIGDCGEPLTTFRRGRADVGLVTSRRSQFLRVHPSSAESALLAAVDRYARAIWNARGRTDRAVRLIAMTMARRAASSATAIERTLARRLSLLGTAAIEPTQGYLPWEEEDQVDDVEGDALLSIAGLESGDQERRFLSELIALAQQCGVSSKTHRLRRLLTSITEPVIVFTEYRDTLMAVERSVASLRRVGTIHGGLSPELRRHSVDAFNDGRLDVLVATDAAGEGLNLHHRCRLVVDLEVPWNPLRLEQRIGRVDRLGQRRRVHAIRLFHPGTIEQQVLDHLRLRARRADAAFDRPGVSEAALARAIFDGVPVDTIPAVEIRSDRVDVAASEVRRLEDQRRVRQSSPPNTGPCWAAPGTLRPQRLLLLHRVTSANARGVVIGEQIDARALTLTSPPANRREWRMAIAQARQEPLTPLSEFIGGRDDIARRIEVIRARVTRRSGGRLQASLFDGRAEQDLETRRLDAVRLDAALLETKLRVDSSTADVRSELLAAWPEHRR
jgi:ERCC4-related helicase